MQIGQKINSIAKSKNISVRELAVRIGRTPQTIYDIVNERVSLNVELLEKIAQALDEPIFNFFIESEDAYYDMIPKVIPIEEIHKLMHNIHETAKNGNGLVNLSLTMSREGMFILEYEFHKLKDKLNQETIDRFGNKLYESLVKSSPKFTAKEKNSKNKRD